MRIHAIRGRNLASFEGHFAVDFLAPPLAGAGVFAITGPTGAGKSTLLDALCLALFDKVPRLLDGRGHEIGEDGRPDPLQVSTTDPRSLLRRGQAEGFAEVDFSGQDGTVWRSRWSVRRARGQATGKLQNASLTLHRLTGRGAGAQPLPADLRNDNKTTTLEAIQSVLGLTFDQFRRAVLLAQGEFAAFLKAPPKERSALLERITGTGIYSQVSRAAFRRAGEETARREQLLAGLRSLPVLEPEARSALEQEAQAQTTAVREIETALAALDALDQWERSRQSLASALESAMAAATSAEAAWQAAAPRYQRLTQIQALEPLRLPLRLARQARDEQEQARSRQSAAATAALSAKQAVDAAQTAQTAAIVPWETARQALAAAQPALDAAAALDRLLTEGRQEAAATAAALAAAEQERKQVQADLASRQSRRQELEQQQAVAQAWLADRAGLAPLAAADARWPLLFRRWGEETAALMTARADAARHTAALQALRQTLEQAEAAVMAAQAQRQIALEALAEGESTPPPPREPLRQAAAAARAARQAWKTVQALAETYGQQTAAATDLRNEECRLGQQAAEAESRAATARHDLIREDGARQEAQTQATRLRLATAADVVALRRRLETGFPCPVCGAAEHPWASADRTSSSPGDLSPLERLAHEQEARCSTLNARCRALERSETEARTEAQAIRRQQAERQQELRAKEREVETLLSSWQEQPAWLELPPLGDTAAIMTCVQTGLAAADAELTRVDAQEQAADAWEAEQRRRRQSRDETQAAWEKAHRGALAIRDRLHTQEDGCRTATEAVARSRQTLAMLRQELEPLLAPFAPWPPADPAPGSGVAGPTASEEAAPESTAAALEHLRQNLTREVEDWREMQHQQTETAATLAALDAEQREAETRCSEVEGRCQQAALQDVAGKQRLAEWQQERQALLDGEAVITVRQRLQHALTSAETAHSTALAALHDAQHQQTAADEALSLTTAALAQRQAAAATAEQDLSTAIAAAGYDRQSVETILDAAPADLRAEQQALTTLEQNRQAAAIRVSERRQAFDAHMAARPPFPPDLSCEISPTIPEAGTTAPAEPGCDEQARILAMAVRDRSAILKAAGEIACARRDECRGRLASDQGFRNQWENLAESVARQNACCEIWDSLNSLIGSHDGQKLRNYAQGLSLEVLLARANQHLQDLFPRYRLERAPGSDLDLQVRDRDMGDFVRGVSSLSGGETFLVSLALALGLAGLSGGRQHGETLFIDEGFGSLDPESLDLALGVLETLHASGRQVGIVSHVPALIERLGVQIRVLPQGNGRSLIRVAGPTEMSRR